MAGNGPMMTYKDYEKVIEQPKGITQHSAIAAQSTRLTFSRQGGAPPVPGAEQQGPAGQLHQPRLPRAPSQEGPGNVDIRD